MDKLEEALKWIVNILNKHDIPFQISGGFAAHIYGATRPVNDIDLDIPDDKIEVLAPYVEEYIIYGPQHHLNNRWDLQLVTLNYKGQEIDISGADNIKIHDDTEGVWKSFKADLTTAKMHEVFGMQLPVVAPQYLADYKKLLSGDHQKVDVKAVEQYILNNK